MKYKQAMPRETPLDVKPGDYVRSGKIIASVVAVTETDMKLDDNRQYPLSSPFWEKASKVATLF